MKTVTIPVTFTISTTRADSDCNGWLSSELAGRVCWLSTGGGSQSGRYADPHLVASVHGPGTADPDVYARADVTALARTLWAALVQAQYDAAALAEEDTIMKDTTGQETGHG